jgi:ADP-heptose:LPS heptosyltransferase
VDNELSTMGFKNVVKNSQLKIGRSKLKSRFLAWRTKCPINIEPTHWEKLKVYWSKPKTKKKVKQMVNV